MRRRDYTRFVLALCTVLAGCGGGGGGGGSNSLPVSPTTSPSQSPGGLTLSTSSMAIGGTAQQSSFGVTESGYSGSFTAQLDPSCASIVSSVSPAVATGPSATFTVTTGSSVGSCSLYITDASGHKATLSISVAQINGVLQ